MLGESFHSFKRKMLGPKLKDLFTQMTNNKKRLNSQKPTVMEETTREASWINSSQRWGYGLKLFSRIILSEHFDYKPNTEYHGYVGLGGEMFGVNWPFNKRGNQEGLKVMETQHCELL